MPTIGELVIDIKASTASIQTDMTKLQGTMASSSAAIVSSLNKIVDVMIFDIGVRAVRGLASMVERTIEAGDRLGRLSIQTGLSTEALSKYAYAAKMADIDIETFSAGMSRLAFKLEDAASGNKKLRAEFAAFGIDASKIRDPEQALIKLNEAFSRLYEGDKARVIAASIEFFSRAGFRLLPFLTMAPAQMRELTRELEQLGGIWDAKGVQSAEALHESLKRLDTIWGIFGKRLMLDAAPSIEIVLNALVNLTKNAQIFQPTIEAIGKIVGRLAVEFYLLAEAITKTLAEMEYFANLYRTVVAPIGENIKNIAIAAMTGGTGGATKWVPIDWAGAAKGADKYLDAIDASNTRIDQFQISLKGTGELGAHTWKALGAGAEDVANKQSAAIDQIIKKLDEEVATYGMVATQVTLLKAIEAGASEAQLNHITDQIAQLDNLAAIYREIEKRQKAGVAPYGPLEPAAMNQLLGITQQMIPATNELDDSAEKARETMFDFYKGSLTWEEKWQLQTEQIIELWRQYPELGDMAARAIAAQNKAWEEHGKKTSFLVQVQRDISQAFADAIFGADSFGDAMQRLLLRIAEVIFQVKVLDPLLNRLFGIQSPGAGGGGGGGLFGVIGGFFGGLLGFQGGGTFSAGQPFIAGEAGPELIYPAFSGGVIPNNALGGQTVYNIDARGADPTVEFRIRRALRESEQRSVARSVSTTREIGLRNIT